MKKHKILMVVLWVFAIILVANSIKICWNNFIFEKSRSVFYASQDGKQVVLRYNSDNKPRIEIIYDVTLGHEENNREDIWYYEGDKFIIPPSLKISWISENEIQVIGTGYLSRNINENFLVY